MDGIFIAKHFRLGTPAKLDISSSHTRTESGVTPQIPLLEVVYLEVSHFEQTQRRKVS